MMDGVEENDVKCNKDKPGIVYLSRIPRRMNVKQIRYVFGSFGEVGRVFLKPIGDCKLHDWSLPGTSSSSPSADRPLHACIINWH